MNKQLVALTTTIVSLLLMGFAGNRSEAFEIESMRSRNGITTYSNDGYIMHIADVETDEPYFLVDWYVNEVRQTTSFGDGNTTDATFCLPDPVSGSIRGATYTIKAFAEPWEGDGNDSRSYTVTVYDPKIDSGTGTNTGVWGYSRLSRQYLSGTSINVDCYIYANNSTGATWEGLGRFIHDVRDSNDNIIAAPEEDQPTRSITPGNTYGPYHDSSLSVSISGALGKEFESRVYVKLIVRKNTGAGKIIQDEWFVSSTETFER